MATTMTMYPESPMDPDDVVYPCKGCGDILEEGKAFELAGHRWHIECFKCNTCGTILDSDANLLLLGDGSLICNNCTYSCSACGQKIQDLAILTGDQAYCADCFCCRNCKKKIENLRYARTRQGMFCMECHDALMARRRKKTKNAGPRTKQPGANIMLDKSLPSLPPTAATESSAFSPDSDNLFSGPSGPPTPTELPGSEIPLRRHPAPRSKAPDISFGPQELEGSVAPSTEPSKRRSVGSDNSGGDGFMIPINIDPSLVNTPPVSKTPQDEKIAEKENTQPGSGPDYFTRKPGGPQRQPREAKAPILSPGSTDSQISPRTSLREAARNHSDTRLDVLGSTASPRASAERSREPSPLMPRGETDKDIFMLEDTSAARKGSTSAKDTIFAGARTGDSTDGNQPRPSLGDYPQHASNTSIKVDTSLQQAPGTHPKRNDSLAAGVPQPQQQQQQQPIQRKQVAGPNREPKPAGISSPTLNHTSSPNVNGISTKPISSPLSKTFPEPMQKSEKRPGPGGPNESYTSPRPRHQRNASITEGVISPAEGSDGLIAANREAAELSDDRGDGEHEQSLLKRMSNSMRHARTNSDRNAGKTFKENKGPAWSRSPMNGSATAELLAGFSPAIGSPESAYKDSEYYKSQLHQQRMKNAEQEKKIAELKEMMEGPKTTIKQMNTELREKRSTMVVLDTQKEIVVRELELLQPMAAAKKSGDTADMGKNSPAALKGFAAALQKLKDQFAPEIEELMEKKSTIEEDIARLTRERDRLQQEFDQMSLMNQRLMDTMNEHAHTRIAEQGQGQAAHGLGIFNQGDRLRDGRPPSSDTHVTGSTLVHDLGSEEPIVMAPKVIDVRKNKGAKFNWKKGGIVAKSVGKGLKDAFSSDRTQHFDQQNGAYAAPAPAGLEGTPYGSMQSGSYPSTTLPKDYKVGDGADRQAAAVMFNQNKGRSTPLNQVTQIGGEIVEPPHKIYGSLLQARAEFEGVDIPMVVVRCVQEVQSRGMDVEGIYRKSGSSLQVNEIKAGFEKSPDFDISDVEMDIHAVTGALKQYFRKLPNPLITFEVYDKLIATAPRAPVQPMMGGGSKGGENGGAQEVMSKEERIRKTREALAGLPKAHGATLSFLIFHLAKVRREEKVNLMHSLNLSVVFAPTIMRPVEIAREMLDTPGKTDCVRFMIENCEDLFLRG